MTEKTPTLEVLANPWGITGTEVDDRFVLVIDVLRACTTIAYALDAGARAVIPVESVAEAMRLAQSLDAESTLLCGEQNSVRVEGFHIGNSPAEVSARTVGEKTLVLSTTNGARALARLGGARECVAASFVNLAACAKRVAAEDHITIVCAASRASLALEDFVCAGHLVSEIGRLAPGVHRLDDGARTALAAHEGREEELPDFLARTDHGRLLLSLGFGDDIELAAQRDRFAVVPTLRGGRIVAEGEPVA